MKSPWGIYTVAALSTVYSLLTIVYATRTAGQRWPGVFAALLLIGAIASVLGLLPGVLLCSGCAVACWVVSRYFRGAEP